MKHKDHMNDDLLVKYLLRIAEPDEQVAVEQWLAADPEHQRYFDHFRLIWDESKKLAAVSTVNENDAWQRFQQRVNNNNDHGARIVEMQPRRNNWLRIAAAVTVLLGATGAWFWWQGHSSANMNIIQTAMAIRLDTLPDGSMVTLNKLSKLSYPASFGKVRQVKLEGEAFFNIATDPSKPFVLKVNDVEVKVLGTSFNVKSSGGQTEVIVETGAVEVVKNKNSVQLKSHEKATVADNQDAPVKQDNTDELYNYYRTSSFVCNDTPLWKLANILQEAYGVHITIADSSKRNMPITTTFANSSLDSILRIISLTYNITVDRDGDQITLK
ncbi:FecR domain-containing protein [Chitinophaga vietnamensis]|uniref:FecR domain-containing protein n=1 Tax=Chitinophaga vietnamensis TaxID=2593957 RepID=UPI0011785A10|nr:FecR domain-containing protein [Chitinophaga vietnamensis]